jgi:hypothetical protein
LHVLATSLDRSQSKLVCFWRFSDMADHTDNVRSWVKSRRRYSVTIDRPLLADCVEKLENRGALKISQM